MKFSDIIMKWPSIAAYGEDIGIGGEHAQTMKTRDSIPAKYWLITEEAARKRGIEDVNIKLLAQIAAVKGGVEGV